jgi:ethanolamine ammonia-lyase large subunit
MIYRHAIGDHMHVFADLRTLMAKATPPRSGDRLAGIAAETAEEMIAARLAQADVPRPGADDVMLNYRSTSFHDMPYIRDLFGLKRAPEFDGWLQRVGLSGADLRIRDREGLLPDLAACLIA